MDFVPLSIVHTLIFLFGIIIGSFLNVVIYRLHTGKSLNDRSHCLSCAQTLSWFDLVPVLSYVLLRGRCRSCGAYIPFRYIVVEVLTGCVFLGVFWSMHIPWLIGLFWILLSILIVGLVYDLYHMIIPDEVVVAAAFVAVAIVGYKAYLLQDVSVLGWAMVSGAISFSFFGILWKMSGGRWIGFGDVKLSLPLGFLLSFSEVFSFIILSFWVGATVSLFLLLGQYLQLKWRNNITGTTRKFTMQSEIPFAPFLVSAFVLVLLFGIDILEVTTYVVSFI